MKYRLYLTSFNEEFVALDHDNGTTTFIPNDPANTDYQEYLEWLAEGNTPEPAE